MPWRTSKQRLTSATALGRTVLHPISSRQGLGCCRLYPGLDKPWGGVHGPQDHSKQPWEAQHALQSNRTAVWAEATVVKQELRSMGCFLRKRVAVREVKARISVGCPVLLLCMIV